MNTLVWDIRPGSRSSRSYRSCLVADMGHYHLRITIESRDDMRPNGSAESVLFKMHKEWRRGYPNRPKWRKFGFYASLALKQHHVLKDVEHVHEI
jgi:hypothetical protein